MSVRPSSRFMEISNGFARAGGSEEKDKEKEKENGVSGQRCGIMLCIFVRAKSKLWHILERMIMTFVPGYFLNKNTFD